MSNVLKVSLQTTIYSLAQRGWSERRHFSSVRIESFHIAEHLQISVLILNATLLRFVLGRNPTDWHNFTHDINELDGWLKLQHPSTAREHQEMVRVRTELEAYRTEANAIASSSDQDRSTVLNVLSKIESASQKLLSLGYDLASAHRAAAAQVVDAAQKSLTVLQGIIFGALVLLFGIDRQHARIGLSLLESFKNDLTIAVLKAIRRSPEMACPRRRIGRSLEKTKPPAQVVNRDGGFGFELNQYFDW
jgi:hypothetical protein